MKYKCGALEDDAKGEDTIELWEKAAPVPLYPLQIPLRI
jgi:hypothetical protein